MSRIRQVFEKGPAYIGYLTAGDGGFEHSLNSIIALINGGIDILEIGVPFSDPVADGPTIAQASRRAIQQGMSLQKVLELIAEVRKVSDIPIILFSYYNPIFKYKGNLYSQAKKLKIDGCLIVDLPFEESQLHLDACKQYQIDPIFLVSPTTSMDRIKQFNQHASGMLYYVCRNGATGVKDALPTDFDIKIKQIKQQTELPVVVGFGISTRKMAGDAIAHSDGFVIGSLFVDKAHKSKNPADLTQLALEIDPR